MEVASVGYLPRLGKYPTLATDTEVNSCFSGGVGAVVRFLPPNPKVPGSIPGSAETGIFGDFLSR